MKKNTEASCVCRLGIFNDEGEESYTVRTTVCGEVKLETLDENGEAFATILMDFSDARAVHRALGFLLKEVDRAGLDDGAAMEATEKRKSRQ